MVYIWFGKKKTFISGGAGGVTPRQKLWEGYHVLVPKISLAQHMQKLSTKLLSPKCLNDHKFLREKKYCFK